VVCLIWGTILTFAWKFWGKPRNPQNNQSSGPNLNLGPSENEALVILTRQHHSVTVDDDDDVSNDDMWAEYRHRVSSLLLGAREVQGAETGNIYWDVSLFSSVLPVKHCASTLNYSTISCLHKLSNSLFANHPTIPHYTIIATVSVINKPKINK
jgi:hypothetical protein